MRRALSLAICVWVASTASSAQTATANQVDPRINTVLTAVSEARLRALVEHLASFRTRHLLSNPSPSGNEIGAARQWILDEFRRSSSRLQVSFETYSIPAQTGRIPVATEVRNVVAILPGRSARRVYVIGHYDSRSVDLRMPGAIAPGANDDGSGTALTMELARVFAESGLPFDATLVFMATAGEEEYWVGSRLHAQHAIATSLRIDAVLSNDIVGGVSGGNGMANTDTVRVFSEGPEDSPSRQLARYVRDAAVRYYPSQHVQLVALHDRFTRGGDHSAFNQHGFAAVRVTEEHENYAKQHAAADTPDGVSFPYLARNARVNAAAVAMLALAPPAPVVTDKTGAPTLSRGAGYDAHLAWQAAPGAAGYRVYSRRAWNLDWETIVTVGPVTDYTFPGVTVDDRVFGVASLDQNGNESLVSVYKNPTRPDVIFKVTPAAR